MVTGPSRRLLIGGGGSAQNRRGRSIGVCEPGEVTGSMDPDEDTGEEGGPLSGHLTFAATAQKGRLDLKNQIPGERRRNAT